MQEAVQQIDFPLIGLLTGFLSLPLKFLVDVIRRNFPSLPGERVPVIGIGVAYILCMIVVAAAPQITFNVPTFFECLLAAITMQATAMGITEFQTKTNKVEEKINAALLAPQGTSRKELDEMVTAKAGV